MSAPKAREIPGLFVFSSDHSSKSVRRGGAKRDALALDHYAVMARLLIWPCQRVGRRRDQHDDFEDDALAGDKPAAPGMLNM